jgi:hypothetical protein
MPGSGDGNKSAEDSSGDALMNREEALQLIESVRPQAFAAQASQGEIRERTIERDW